MVRIILQCPPPSACLPSLGVPGTGGVMTMPTGSECRRAQLGTGGVTTPTGTECGRAGLGVQRLLEFSAPPLCPRQTVTIPKPTLQVCRLPSCVLHPRPYKGAPGGPTLIARAPVLVRGSLPPALHRGTAAAEDVDAPVGAGRGPQQQGHLSVNRSVVCRLRKLGWKGALPTRSLGFRGERGPVTACSLPRPGPGHSDGSQLKQGV